MTSKQNEQDCQYKKVQFDLDQINELGLIGPPDGLRMLDYEFCIPDDPENIQEVRRVDANIQFHKGSKGRIGCESDQVLCLGSTDKHFRAVLCRLSMLSFVDEIRQNYWE